MKKRRYLDQPTLDITSFSSLDSSINKTFSSSHGVEIELTGCQAGKVRILNEATRLGSVIVLGWYNSLYILLPEFSVNRVCVTYVRVNLRINNLYKINSQQLPPTII